jgi:hypothetical protein
MYAFLVSHMGDTCPSSSNSLRGVIKYVKFTVSLSLNRRSLCLLGTVMYKVWLWSSRNYFIVRLPESHATWL